MAIEKSLLTTQGWSLNNAYYKVYDVQPLTGSTHLANIWVYLNKQERQVNPDAPLQKNRMKFDVDFSSYLDGISETENKIKQAYGKLKLLTDSFQNASTDV